MEYSEWEKWEKEYPWLWAIVWGGHLESRRIGCCRASDTYPTTFPKRTEDDRAWIASGATGSRFKRPRVFRIEEIPWEMGLSLHQQARQLEWKTGFYGLYLVIGTIRPYPHDANLTIYKRPHGVEDFRSLLY